MAHNTSQPASPSTTHQRQSSTSYISAGAIPRLGSITPAIFVPITRDFTKPPSSYDTPSEGIRASLNRHTQQTHAVRENIMMYHHREAYRSTLEQPTPSDAQQRQQQQQQHGPGRRYLPPEQQALMLRNLEAAAHPLVQHNITGIPEVKPAHLSTAGLRTLACAVRDVQIYDAHAKCEAERLREELRAAEGS